MARSRGTLRASGLLSLLLLLFLTGVSSQALRSRRRAARLRTWDALRGSSSTNRWPLQDELEPQQQPQQQQRGVPPELGPARSVCSAAAQALFDTLAVGFNSSSSRSFSVQAGYVDFAMAATPVVASNTSTSSSSSPSCAPDCSYTNPSAAYGVTVLPLAPSEDLQAKLADPLTPRDAAQNLADGRYGPRMAPSWQLQQDEVVVLAGCTPPPHASRYFAATGYLHSTFLEDEEQWLEVFGSLSDSLSLIRPATAADAAPHSRLATSLPLSGDLQAPAQASASRDSLCSSLERPPDGAQPAADTHQPHRGAFSALTVVLMGANPQTVGAAAAWMRQLAAAACCANSQTAAANTTTSSSSSSADCSQLPINILPVGPGFSDSMGLNATSPYFTLVVRNIAPAGQGGAAAFADWTQQPHLMAWRLTPRAIAAASAVAAAAVGQAGGSTAGVDDAAGLPAGAQLAAAVASAAAATATLQDTASFPTAAVRERSVPFRYERSLGDSASGEPAELQPTQPSALWQQHQQLVQQLFAGLNHTYSQHGAFELSWGLGSMAPLAVLGVDWGLDCLQQKLDWCNGDNRDATYHSTLPFATLDTPGQALLVAGLNYVRAGAAVYMNVAVTDPVLQQGLLAFDDTELAASGPAAAAALSALSGPVVAALQGGLLFVVAVSRNCSGVTPLLCKELPAVGAAVGPQPPALELLRRPVMTLARAYVNPATGVGPDPAELVPFNTLLLTPQAVGGGSAGGGSAASAAGSMATVLKGVAGAAAGLRPQAAATAVLRAQALPRVAQPAHALPAEYAELAARYKLPECPATPTAAAEQDAVSTTPGSQPAEPDPCVRSIIGLSQCTPQGSADVCCAFVAEFEAAGCWCRPSAQRLLASLPAGSMTTALLQLLGWVCDEEV